MENVKNRRFHERLPLRLNVLCQTVGLSGGRAYTGSTIDVSSGGMLVEINDGRLNEGQLLSIEMSVPPTTGLLEYGGVSRAMPAFAELTSIGASFRRAAFALLPWSFATRRNCEFKKT